MHAELMAIMAERVGLSSRSTWSNAFRSTTELLQHILFSVVGSTSFLSVLVPLFMMLSLTFALLTLVTEHAVSIRYTAGSFAKTHRRRPQAGEPPTRGSSFLTRLPLCSSIPENPHDPPSRPSSVPSTGVGGLVSLAGPCSPFPLVCVVSEEVGAKVDPPVQQNVLYACCALSHVRS